MQVCDSLLATYVDDRSDLSNPDNASSHIHLSSVPKRFQQFHLAFGHLDLVPTEYGSILFISQHSFAGHGSFVCHVSVIVAVSGPLYRHSLQKCLQLQSCILPCASGDLASQWCG
jgi:hypothetical protein